MVIWLILRFQIWSLKYEWERNCYLSILFCGIWGILTENQLLTVTHLSRFTLFETITINHSYWSFQLEFLSKNSFTLSEFHFERNRLIQNASNEIHSISHTFYLSQHCWVLGSNNLIPFSWPPSYRSKKYILNMLCGSFALLLFL